MATITWDARKAKAEILRKVERGMTRATLHLERKVIEKIGTGQPARTTAGGHLVGLDPSKPGEPPHVLSGRLRQSTTHQVEVGSNYVRGRVGTNVEYARRLELGFTGTDAAGRNVNQAPRPFLRPTLAEERAEILRRIVRG